MRTEQKSAPLAERLSSEDLNALRHRYVQFEGEFHVREDGAATIADVAEAVGIEPGEVGRQLDRIRAERANRSAPKSRPDQRGLLALAIVLFGSAYAIRQLLVPPTEEMKDAQIQNAVREMNAKRRKNRPITYPIKNVVESGALPPAGFKVEFQGLLTTTTTSSKETGFVTSEVAKKQLAAALAHAFEVAQTAEAKAPPPTRPLPKRPTMGFGTEPAPGRFLYRIDGNGSGSMGTIDLLPQPGAPALTKDEIYRRLAQTAESCVDNLVASQEQSLTVKPFRASDYVFPPVGFGIAFKGQQSSNMGNNRLAFLPKATAEPAIARKLEWVVRALVWKDAVPPPPFMGSRAMFAKRPVPAYAEVTFDGPLEPVVFKLPMTASAAYPTAADAARAADRILAEKAREAAAQIGRLYRGERRP